MIIEEENIEENDLENNDKQQLDEEQCGSDEEVEEQETGESGCSLGEEERQEYIDQILRLKADFDNYKRRTENQISQIRETANEELIKELLPAIDNFERAIRASEKNDEDSSLLSGVKMIFEQLMISLGKQGLEPIECIGQPFDPNIHEAVSMEGNPGDDLIVIAELQKGYMFKGKVIRVCLVQVAQSKQEEEE